MKDQSDLLRNLVNKALTSQAIYTKMVEGREDLQIYVIRALYKWPDVVLGMLDYIDGKDVQGNLVSDLGDIILYPLMAIVSAYIERTNLPGDKKARYKVTVETEINKTDPEAIMKKREELMVIMTELSGFLKEDLDEHKNSGGS